RHVPRQDRGAGTDGGALRGAEAPLHAGAPVGGGHARPGRAAQPEADRARRRRAEPARAAVGLQVQDALSARSAFGAAVGRGGARAQADRARPPRRVPPRRPRRRGAGGRRRRGRSRMTPFTTRPELRGTFGMVASTHWLATAAGMAVLERGGNAFDAAVATGFTLQVVEPHFNGPGGDLPVV